MTSADLIHATGGARDLGAPGRDGRLELLETLVASGLDGAEVLHPGHSPEDVKRLGALCDHLRILPSGGSDWHGETTGNRVLGGMHVPAEWLARQDERVAARRTAGASMMPARRVVLVTGASRRVGRAIAVHLAGPRLRRGDPLPSVGRPGA